MQAIARFAGDEYAEDGEQVAGRWATHFESIPPGSNYKFHTAWADHPDPTFLTETRFWNFLLKLHPDLPAWTIAANPGPWTGPFHWANRRLRTAELAALQGFPDGYVFVGGRRDRVRQIGNAVPPGLAAVMVRQVLLALGVKQRVRCSVTAAPTFTCASLFSGCGGLDLGLRRAGFDVVFAEDVDPHCAESHRANFPETPFHHGSITDLSGDMFWDTARTTEHRIDLLAGGPPCPPYSKSRFYRKEKPRALGDPVGWESINGYLRALEFIRPRAFLLENVPGLAYTVHADALALIRDTARDLGYTVEHRVLNAADYGVPQIRERLFVVGTESAFSWPEPTHAEDATPGLFDSLKPWVTAGDALHDLDTEENADDTGHFAGGGHHGLLEQVPPGENYLFFTEKRGHPQPIFEWRSRYWSFLLKLSPDLPAWTIQARRSNNMGPFHWRSRILRIPEIMRLQSFPDSWTVAGRVTDQWRQIGNAVPPLLAERLGQSIAASLSRGSDQSAVALASENT